MVGTNEFPESKAIVIGGIEVFTGLGCIFGPLIGAVLIKNFGFASSFRIVGFIIVLFSLVFTVLFPKAKGK